MQLVESMRFFYFIGALKTLVRAADSLKIILKLKLIWKKTNPATAPEVIYTIYRNDETIRTESTAAENYVLEK